jgi:hypothetical protein
VIKPPENACYKRSPGVLRFGKFNNYGR